MNAFTRAGKFRAAKFWAGLLLCLGILASTNITIRKSQAAGRLTSLSTQVAASATTEILLADDGTAETFVSGNNAIVVNRLTPTAYPATLQSIRLQFPQVQGLPSPVGSQVKLIAFAGAAGATKPTANPTLLVNQTATIPDSATSGFFDFDIANGPTISSGDFYVGFQAPSPFGGVVFAADVNGAQRQRSFVSVNNGATFTGPLMQGATLVNALIRAVVISDTTTTARINVPTSFSFGNSNIGVAQQQNLPVANTGSVPLTITGITPSSAQFAVVSPSLPLTIAAGGQAQIALRFTPSAAGIQSGTLTIASNDPANATASVALIGFGGTATVPATVFIGSGAAISGSIPVASSGGGFLFGTQYAILVPSGVTELKLDLTATQDVDLFARFNQRITLLGTSAQADHSSTNTSTTPETIIVTSGGSPALRSGLYYIAVINYGSSAANFTLTAKLTGGATPGAVATVSAASFLGPEESAELIGAFFGTNLATGTQIAEALPLPTTLLGTTVKIRDSAGMERSAPLFFVSPGQINALIPTGTATGSAQVVITSGDEKVSVGTIFVSSVAPGLFAANANGQGVPAATILRVKGDSTQSYEALSQFDAAQGSFVAVPIDLGEATDQVFLILNGTGIRGRTNLAAVTATIGGAAAPVIFAGPQGDFVGLDQINVGPIPRSLVGRGDADVVLTVDGKKTNTLRINIK
jgi:uncharacterized protein (TIGR03437 family)